MLMFSSKLVYYLWACVSLVSSFGFFALYFLMCSNSFSLSVAFTLSDILGWQFNFSLFVDAMSAIFSGLVCLITFVVMLFSVFYMSSYVVTVFFSLLTALFVCSMLLVINMSDLLMIMLGWDGLGVVSFFLIVFYQSSVSIFSGIFTLLMNRIGDALIIVSVMFMGVTSMGTFSFVFWQDSLASFVCILLCALMTKSAIFPFSPWLPAAMAAPTPISSLVHSSTLVTAGLYLMMRFSSYLYLLDNWCFVMVVLGVFTSFYAGMNSLFEVDLKKLVALSTLSHLGFICTSLFSGYITLSFLHLLAHAAFKSLLFVSVGGLMVNMSHYQDSRYFSGGLTLSSHFSYFATLSSCSLLGFPFMSGFYSKDYILESFYYSLSSYVVIFFVLLNVVFTYIYTLRIVLGLTSSAKISSYFMSFSPENSLLKAMWLLGSISIVVSSLFLWSFDFSFSPLLSVSLFKYYPLLMSCMVLGYFSFFFNLFSYSNVVLVEYFSTMMYLSSVCSNVSSKFYYSFSKELLKNFEGGMFNSLLNLSFMSYLNYFISLFSSLFYYISGGLLLVLLLVLFTLL